MGEQLRTPEDDIKSLVGEQIYRAEARNRCPILGIRNEALDEEKNFGPPVLKKLAAILITNISTPKSKGNLNKLSMQLNLP